MTKIRIMSNEKKIITNIIWKFAERILAQSVSLIVSIVLARLLLPSDYGAVAMVMVFIAIANEFVVSGIPTALIQKKDADELDFSSVFYFNVCLSMVIYAVIFAGAGYIADFYNNDILKPVLRVLGLRIIVASVNSVQHSYVARHLMFKKYFWSTLFGTVLSGVIGIFMAYKGFGVWALVAQYLINTTVDTIVLFITVNWRPKWLFSFERVKKLFQFGWKILFEGLSNTVQSQLTNLIIGKVYTSGDLAYYTKGQQFPSLIVTNITSSIGAVLFPAMANEQDKPEQVLNMLRKSVRVSTYVVYPMLIGLAAVAEPFIRVVLTEKWIETVPYLIFFCILNLPTVGMIPRHQALNGTGRSDVYMNEHIIARIVAVVLLLLTYKISILAILIGGALSSLILTLIIAYTSKRFNGYGYRDQVKDILPTCIGCAVMGVLIYLISYLGMPDMITLIVQIIAGVIIYIAYSMFFKLEEFEICRNFMLLLASKMKRTGGSAV